MAYSHWSWGILLYHESETARASVECCVDRGPVDSVFVVRYFYRCGSRSESIVKESGKAIFESIQNKDGKNNFNKILTNLIDKKVNTDDFIIKIENYM